MPRRRRKPRKTIKLRAMGPGNVISVPISRIQKQVQKEVKKAVVRAVRSAKRA